jgi:hypothetical protein
MLAYVADILEYLAEILGYICAVLAAVYECFSDRASVLDAVYEVYVERSEAMAPAPDDAVCAEKTVGRLTGLTGEGENPSVQAYRKRMKNVKNSAKRNCYLGKKNK